METRVGDKESRCSDSETRKRWGMPPSRIGANATTLFNLLTSITVIGFETLPSRP